VEEGSIADQVLQSNPILEAFGNARTIRNDNSSRFGKFIELHFAPQSGQLTGAAIATYLLEKVRLVSQAANERNFHVFYQLLKGAGEEERAALGLVEWDGGKAAQGFHYLRQSGCVARQDGADDAEEYARLRRALAIMGVSAEEQTRVLRVVAAVLHLGNLRFELRPASGNSPDAAEVAPDALATAERVAGLLGVDPGAFQRCVAWFGFGFGLLWCGLGGRPGGGDTKTCLADATESLTCIPHPHTSSLTDRTIQAGRETIHVKLTPAQAEGARDALAKAVYGNLFLWVVDRVNGAIRSQHRQQQSASVSVTPPPLSVRTAQQQQQMFIGVLDIFGFESFQTNSFEQLCINYANETVRQATGTTDNTFSLLPPPCLTPTLHPPIPNHPHTKQHKHHSCSSSSTPSSSGWSRRSTSGRRSAGASSSSRTTRCVDFCVVDI
jgi:myosin V